MTGKRLPIGICDHCEGEIPAQDWYTAHGQPRCYCSIDCRNTANSRAGSPLRTAKLRQAVAEGRWQNPHRLRPPTGAEQAARARKGRLREVADRRWRNPALDPEARIKLSRPRKHGDDPLLHRVLEQLKQGARMVELSAAEREHYLAYRRQLRQSPSQRNPGLSPGALPTHHGRGGSGSALTPARSVAPAESAPGGAAASAGSGSSRQSGGREPGPGVIGLYREGRA